MKKLKISVCAFILIMGVILSSAQSARRNYRVYNNSNYEIVDTGGFYIYHQYKTESNAKGGLIKRHEYFFSMQAGDEIEPLTINNLDNAFVANTRFRYSVAMLFKKDNELTAYDTHLKMYRIKYLYNESLK